VTSETLARARSGDEDAFRQLTDPYRRELQLHIYRIVGSAQDAEDLLRRRCLPPGAGLTSSRSGHRFVRGCTGSPPTDRWTHCGRAGADRKICNG
jgi:RNA polymerase sigma-70 factor (ECF subfamily)